MMREPFPVPETIIYDAGSGYPINIPLGRVVPPQWQTQYPEMYQRILDLRKLEGITIDDDELVTKDPVFVDIPRKRPASVVPLKPKKKVK